MSNFIKILDLLQSYMLVSPPWRNGLACRTSNKVVGSSPTGGG